MNESIIEHGGRDMSMRHFPVWKDVTKERWVSTKVDNRNIDKELIRISFGSLRHSNRRRHGL